MEPSTFRIEAYEFGSITIGGKTYTRDLIICPDGIRTDWWRREGHSLCPEDLDSVIGLDPEVLIIGCGRDGRLKVPDETRSWITRRGIELIALPTREACERYNELEGESKVIAGLHLTC
jgi:hypothetical protein